MKVLVLGSSGMLGHVVLKYLREKGFEVWGTSTNLKYGYPHNGIYYFDALNESEFTELHGFADNLKDFDYVINCIGIIKPKINLNIPASITETIKINSVLPHELAEFAQKFGFKVIHASTDCIFNGEGCVPYTENDYPDAQDLYGRSKAMGESPYNMNLRCSIIGPASENKSLWEWYLAQTSQVKGFVNHYWNGITTLEWSKVVNQIIQRDLWTPGVYHIPGETVTKNKILERIKEAYGTGADIILSSAEETRYMVLDTLDKKFISNFNIAPLNEQIKEMVKWNQNSKT